MANDYLNNKSCNYSSITEVVDILNNSGIPYLVLRNFENLLNDNIYISGHEDIDILCENSEDIAQLLNAKQNKIHQRGPIKDLTHYYIYIANQKVSLDLRHYGDGYYCNKWEYDMLNNRSLYNNFYAPQTTDYFYSLIYHAIIQKKNFTEEYRIRLSQMAKKENIILDDYNETSFIQLLESFMIQKGYNYTFCQDFYIPLQFHKVSKSLIKHDRKLKFRHLIFKFKVYIIESLVKIKHSLVKQN